MVAFSHACKATFIALMDTYKTATMDLEKGDLATLPEVIYLKITIKNDLWN